MRIQFPDKFHDARGSGNLSVGAVLYGGLAEG